MKQHSRFPTLLAASCVAVASLWLLGSCGSANKDASPPLSIGKLQQARLLEDQAALNVVHTMHPTPTAPLRAWVGYYGGGDGITIYASRFPDAAQAQSTLEAVRSAIDKGSDGYSGFSPAQAFTAGKQPGFHTSGMKKEHFFYTHGPWLVWIEGKPTDLAPTVGAMRWGKASRGM